MPDDHTGVLPVVPERRVLWFQRGHDAAGGADRYGTPGPQFYPPPRGFFGITSLVLLTPQDIEVLDWTGAWYFIGAGVMHFLIGRYTNYKCTKAVGANIGGPIQQFTVVVSVVLAIWVLGESINWLGWVGIVLLTVGPLAVAKEKKKSKVEKLEFEFKLIEGYAYGITSSICYGASPVLIALALEVSTWQLALYGAFLGHVAASLVLLVIVLAFGLTGEIRATDKKNIPFFMLSAVFVFLSQGLRYVALALAPVYIECREHRPFSGSSSARYLTRPLSFSVSGSGSESGSHCWGRFS